MSKDKEKYIVFILIIAIFLIIILVSGITKKKTFVTNSQETFLASSEKVKISNAPKVDLEKIIRENTKFNKSNEEIYTYEEELEYLTKYRKSDEIYEGTSKVAQEGRNGIQKITIKRVYDENNNLVKEEQISAVVIKASLNKIIEIGTKKKEVVKNYSVDGRLDFNMALNKPSGFTLEQFEKALTDEKDKNNIFKENAKYFYYIENQYNINGLFVAAVGIHESNWGNSKIASKKYNLFGYGAYDSNPYNGAYKFESYSESIDLIARVFAKYYLNPKGTTIYDGQVANGKYHNGNTLSAVNKKYATDKNWANGVYKHMNYLYSKLR